MEHQRNGRIRHVSWVLDPLVQTGRGSYVFYRSTTLDKLLESFDRAHPDFTDCTRQEVIDHWRSAELWIQETESLQAKGRLPVNTVGPANHPVFG